LLVIDTKIMSDFLKTLETVGPSHAKTILRFCQEVAKNAQAFESKNEMLERAIQEMEVQHEVEGNV